jgi:hypothetical protein
MAPCHELFRYVIYGGIRCVGSAFVLYRCCCSSSGMEHDHSLGSTRSPRLCERCSRRRCNTLFDDARVSTTNAAVAAGTLVSLPFAITAATTTAAIVLTRSGGSSSAAHGRCFFLRSFCSVYTRR